MVMEFMIKNYKAIKKSKAELGKIILYGPNAAGKTSTMEVMAAVLTGGDTINERNLITSVDEGFSIEVAHGSVTVKLIYRAGSFIVESKQGVEHYSEPASALRRLKELLDIKFSVSWVDTCSFYSTRAGTMVDICANVYDGLRNLTPEELVKLERALYALIGLSMLRYAGGGEWYVLEDEENRWIKLKDLAYGFKRLIPILTAAVISDVVFIEAFESGLHTDLAMAVLDYLFDEAKYVVIETHHGASVAYAVSKGWKAYYMEDGEVVKELISPQDLADAELFRKEVEAYSILG